MPCPGSAIRRELKRYVDLGEQQPGWLRRSGPYGRGACLMDMTNDAFVEILAPPGVPLKQPRRLSSLVRWRHARWARGALICGPTPVTLGHALNSRARRSTGSSASREREALYRAVGDQPIESVDAVLAARSVGTDVRAAAPAGRAIDWSTSASEFARYVARASDVELAKRIIRVADEADDPQELRRGLSAIYADGHDGGSPQVGGRGPPRWGTSHTWRYGRLLPAATYAPAMRRRSCPARSDRRRDRPRADGPRVARRLEPIRAEWPALDDALAEILFARSHSSRWRRTRWLRQLLGKSELRPVRWILREQVRPRYLQARRLAHR